MSKSVLVVAAHPDDEILGCGGTIARHVDDGDIVHVLIVAEGATSRQVTRNRDGVSETLSTLKAAAEAAGRILGVSSVDCLDLPDNRMDTVALLDIVKLVEAAISQGGAQVVYTHAPCDVNIDHRRLHDAVIAATRPQPGYPVRDLLFFETPSSTEWRPPSSLVPFAPNCFVDITQTLPRKLSALAAYDCEMRAWPHPRSVQAVEHLARWRGASCGVEAAEAFVIGRRII